MTVELMADPTGQDPEALTTAELTADSEAQRRRNTVWYQTSDGLWHKIYPPRALNGQPGVDFDELDAIPAGCNKNQPVSGMNIYGLPLGEAPGDPLAGTRWARGWQRSR